VAANGVNRGCGSPTGLAAATDGLCVLQPQKTPTVQQEAAKTTQAEFLSFTIIHALPTTCTQDTPRPKHSHIQETLSA